MTRHVLYLLSVPARIVLLLARETLDSGAIVVGLRWRDSYGRTHPRRAKPKIPVARVVR